MADEPIQIAAGQEVTPEDRRLMWKGGRIVQRTPDEPAPAIDLGRASNTAAINALPAPRAAKPVPVLPSGQPYPIGRHAGIAGYENPSTDAIPLGKVTPPHPVAVAQLASKAENIHNPILRALAKVGAYAARGLDTAGTILAPGVTAAIPGTTMNEAIKISGRRAEENRQAKVGLEKSETAKNQAEAEAGAKPATNAFELWAQQNPGKPVADWLKTEEGAKSQAPKSAFELWAKDNPKGTFADFQKESAKPDTATQNKENFQHGIGVLRGEGLVQPGDVADAKKIAGAIARSKSLTDAEKNAMVGYLAANPTPATNVTVHNVEAGANQELKQKGGYYAVNGKIVRGDRLTEDQRANAIPVKDPEKAESSIRVTNSTLNQFTRYKNDIDSAKLTADDVKALQVLTDPAKLAPGFLEKDTAGVLDALFGEPLTGYSAKAMNGIMTKDQYDKLSPDGRKLLVGYFNALIANFADMKQRLGSIGRNESMIQAEIHTIPLPYIGRAPADEAFSRKLDDIAGRNIYYGASQLATGAAETGPPPGAKVRDYTDLNVR